ncbi:MAG: hypothetical protein ABSF90_08940 [Syntrophobacteraceae bacterium]
MKKVLFFVTLFFLASISAAFAQTWFYTQPNGQPGGTATYMGPPMQQPQRPNGYMPPSDLKLFDLGKANREIQEQRMQEQYLRMQEQEYRLREKQQKSAERQRHLEDKERAFEQKKVAEVENAKAEIPPEFQEWFDKNQWYAKDKFLQRQADILVDAIRLEEEEKTGKPFLGVPLLNRVREELEKRYPEKFATSSSKVDCRENCRAMFNSGKLKKGMTVNQCIKVLCK